MSVLIRKNISFIRLLAESKSKNQQKALLETIIRDQVKSVIEIAYNAIHLNVSISTQAKEKLLKHISVLKEIGNKKNSQRKITLLVKKNRTAVIVLIQAVLPALENILKK